MMSGGAVFGGPTPEGERDTEVTFGTFDSFVADVTVGDDIRGGVEQRGFRPLFEVPAGPLGDEIVGLLRGALGGALGLNGGARKKICAGLETANFSGEPHGRELAEQLLEGVLVAASRRLVTEQSGQVAVQLAQRFSGGDPVACALYLDLMYGRLTRAQDARAIGALFLTRGVSLEEIVPGGPFVLRYCGSLDVHGDES